MVRTPRLCIRSTKGSSDSLGRIVVGPISMASSAVASGALLQRLAAQATLDDPPRQRRPRPDLIEQGLIDVYELWIDPLVLRTGKASSAWGPKDRAEARGEQASSTGVA